MKNSILTCVGLLYAAASPLGMAQVQAPALNPQEGDSFASFPLTITCATAGAQIHYTLNGAEPTVFDPQITSGSAITINRNWTVKAKAFLGGDESTTATGIFELTGDLAGGGAHSLGLKTGGGIWAWGLQTGGRLGNNATTASNISSPVYSRYSSGAIDDARMVAAGTDHSVFLKNDATVWSFGANATGQLGDNSITSRATAVQVKKSAGATDWLTGAVGVAAGDGFSLTLASNGEVFAWGDKTAGRLGDGSTSGTRLYAGKVFQGYSGTSVLTGISRISSGGGTSLALNSATGSVWTWGTNGNGQLAQGNLNHLSRALRMKLTSSTYVTDVTDIACGPIHSVLLRWKAGDPALQGRVFCSGQQLYGRLGNNLTGAATVTYPVQVLTSGGTALDNIFSVAAGAAHTLALDSTGNVWAWGRNLHGALGDNTTTDRGFAVKVKNPAGTGDLSNIVRIAAGGSDAFGHSIAVAADGTVYAWGYNSNGQLGNGTTSTAATKLPVAVGGAAGNLGLLSKPPDVTLALSITQSFSPGGVTLSASPTDPDNNITKVEFFSRGLLVGQATSAPWQLSLNDLPAGDNHIYAKVSDSSGFAGYSLPQQFNIVQSSSPTVTLAANVAAGVYPGTVTLTASPADLDNNVTRVDFYNDGQLVGQATSAPWQFALSNLQVGNYQASAVVLDSTNLQCNSGPLQYTIDSGSTDSDGDGLPDEWEIQHFGNLDQTGSEDFDNDGLSNAQELALGTTPTNSDSDGDGTSDGDEVEQGTDPKNIDDFPVHIVRMLREALGGDQYEQGDDTEDPGCGHDVWHMLSDGEQADLSSYTYEGYHDISRMLVDLGTIAYPVEPGTDTNQFPRSMTLEAYSTYFDQSVSNVEHQDYEVELTQQAVWIEAPPSPVEKKHIFLKITQSVVNVDNWGNPDPEIDRIGIELRRQDRVESVTITTAPNKRYSERYDLTFPVDMIVDPGGGAMQQIDTRLLPVDLDIIHPATGEVGDGSEDSTSAFVEKGRGGLVAIRRNADTPLTKLVLRSVPGLPTTSKFRLDIDSTLSSGDIKVWKDQACTQLVTSQQTEFDVGVETTLYLEGVKRGLGGDLKIIQEIKVGETWHQGDKVSIAVVHAEIEVVLRCFIPHKWTDSEPPLPIPVAITYIGSYPNLIPVVETSSTIAGDRPEYSLRNYDAADVSFRLSQVLLMTPYKELHSQVDVTSKRREKAALLTEYYKKSEDIPAADQGADFGETLVMGATPNWVFPPDPNPTANYTNAHRSGDVSKITVSLSGGPGTAPFVPDGLTPNIDWEYTISMTRMHHGNPYIRVEVDGNHNLYPAYEVIAQESDGVFVPLYQVKPLPSILPGPISLNQTMEANGSQIDLD